MRLLLGIVIKLDKSQTESKFFANLLGIKNLGKSQTEYALEKLFCQTGVLLQLIRHRLILITMCCFIYARGLVKQNLFHGFLFSTQSIKHYSRSGVRSITAFSLQP